MAEVPQVVSNRSSGGEICYDGGFTRERRLYGDDSIICTAFVSNVVNLCSLYYLLMQYIYRGAVMS